MKTLPPSPDRHDLAGPTALATGASSGIGEAIARMPAARGAKVAAHYLKASQVSGAHALAR